MSSKMRRPASVWIAQIIVLLVGILFSLMAALIFARELAFLANGNVTAAQWLWLFVSVTVKLAFFLFFFFAFWGLAKRRTYGRWLGVATISLLVLISVLGQIYRPKGPMEYYEYENSAQWVGGMFGNLIIYGLFAFLLYRLAFGENVTDFFAAEDGEPSADPPPPNAYFSQPDLE